MGDIPDSYLKATAPFTAVALDIFGPFEVREIKNPRKKLKMWGVLYSCLSSKAVAVWTMSAYDAPAFLEAHHKHVSIYGAPQLILSDHGTQLMYAAKQI